MCAHQNKNAKKEGGGSVASNTCLQRVYLQCSEQNQLLLERFQKMNAKTPIAENGKISTCTLTSSGMKNARQPITKGTMPGITAILLRVFFSFYLRICILANISFMNLKYMSNMREQIRIIDTLEKRSGNWRKASSFSLIV